MNSENIKKALRMAVNVGCGFEGDAEDAASLLSLIETNEARIAELEAERRWIPVSERLPEENAPVLVLTVLGGMFVDFIHGKSVVTGNPDFYELDVEDVTHWMPLPQLPEVQE